MSLLDGFPEPPCREVYLPTEPLGFVITEPVLEQRRAVGLSAGSLGVSHPIYPAFGGGGVGVGRTDLSGAGHKELKR